jgi:phosphoglycerate dehydrogenase-like enzyme
MNNKTLLALILAAALQASNISHADISIETLIERSNLSEGPVAVRDLPRFEAARKVLIWDIGIELGGIVDAFPDVEFVVVPTLAEAMPHAAMVDAIVGFCNDELFDAAPNLVWVQIYWAGAERCLSVDRVADGSVVMTNMQKMSSPVIAEHAIAMMMALSRNLPQFAKSMPTGEWDDRETVAGMMPVAGKTLLVAGLGGIGTEVARLGAALDMRVVGTRNSSREGPDFVEYVGLSHELHDLVAEADIIVNALPLTDGTKKLFDRELFAATKKGTIFVNVGRGQTVDTMALLAALQSGQLGGVGLDVTDPEPLPEDHPLWQQPNVIITPHVAGSGGERERHRVLLMENLRRYIAGEHLLNVVDPQKGY